MKDLQVPIRRGHFQLLGSGRGGLEAQGIAGVDKLGEVVDGEAQGVGVAQGVELAPR